MRVFAYNTFMVTPPGEHVATDLPCLQCGYNLRTQPHDANCPECGEPVIESLQNRLAACGQRNLAIITTGVGLVAIAVVSTLLSDVALAAIFAKWMVSPTSPTQFAVSFLFPAIAYTTLGLFVLLIIARVRHVTWRVWAMLLAAPLLFITFLAMPTPGFSVRNFNFQAWMPQTCLVAGVWLIARGAITDTRRWPHALVAVAVVLWAVIGVMMSSQFSGSAALQIVFYAKTMLKSVLIVAILHNLAYLAALGNHFELARRGRRIRNIAAAVYVVFLLVILGIAIARPAAAATGPNFASLFLQLLIHAMLIPLSIWILHHLYRFTRHLRTLRTTISA